MSVIMETTLGDFVFDLYTDQRPNSSKNFLKLCKMKYYNYCLFHSVRRNFIAQSGDPTGTGKGGESVYGLSYGEQAKYFALELKPRIKHRTKGTISFVNNGNDMHGSQFFVTLGDGLDFLDGKHTVFGQLSEGFEILEQLNETICDDAHKPYKDVRITHTIILEDPFDDPKGLQFPGRSPEPTKEQLDSGRIGADEAIEDTKTRDEIDKDIEDKDLQIGTKILETIGDIPDAELKPPENVLFVCKLNPVTNADDLQIIFSRFGKIESCEIIKDQKTGDSLGYGFIEFEKVKDCEKAYFKMDNVLIDDRRIHVDFCQSVGKLKWKNSANYKKMIAEKGVLKEGVGYKPRNLDSKSSEKYDLLFDEESKDQVKSKSKPSNDKNVTKVREEDEDGISSKKKKKTKKSRGDSDDDYDLSLSEDDNKKSKKAKKSVDRKDIKKQPERSLSPAPHPPSKTSSKKKSSLETKSRAALSDNEASDYDERKTKLSEGGRKRPVVKSKRKQTDDTESSDFSDEDKKPTSKLSKKITPKTSRRSVDVSEADDKLRRDHEKVVAMKKPTRQVSPARSRGSESEDEDEKSQQRNKRTDSSDREVVREKRGKDRSMERKRRHESDSEVENKSKASRKSTEQSKKKLAPTSRSRSPPPFARREKSKNNSSKPHTSTKSSSADSSDEDKRYSKKKSKKTVSETNSKHSTNSEKKGSEKSKRRRADSFASDQSSD